jgi:hypothetical protein
VARGEGFLASSPPNLLLFDREAALRRECCSLTGMLLFDGMAAKEEEVGHTEIR